MASIFAIICYLLGIQIRLKDLYAFRPDVHYVLGMSQWLTALLSGICLFVVVIDCMLLPLNHIGSILCVMFSIAVVQEWILAKLNPQRGWISYSIRFAIIFCLSYVVTQYGSIVLSAFALMGIYLTNCPFGVVRRKVLRLSTYMERKVYSEDGKYGRKIPNCIPLFAYAGCKRKFSLLRKFNVTDYQICPNSAEDIVVKLQKLINRVGETGGGIIYFPKGRYLLGNKRAGNYIQINYSNITIEGENGPNGEPLSELVCCSNTLQGEKNPWLSPFLITTGETLQPSNIFWGLQFKKKKNMVSRSGSLADPGSDGTILTPEFTTRVISEAKKGDRVLKVTDSSNIGHYILLGLYNSTEDGDLIKELLGTNDLRPEWKTPLRAGTEEAPSYQWLVEVERIVDAHTIILAQPLWRDCNLKYRPEIYNVEMLENIVIRNIRLSSRWNGLFRHHGFPLYYSVRQSQEMDYGWNAINMKRVAHGKVENVVIENFTNPLYVMDSRNITCENIKICGHDGHQGIKIYEHACDNLFRNITFTNHFADMIGGEGNAYGNVFSNVIYANPCYQPVDFDFHGFSEGPMSPPANNLFECIKGFRYIKTAAAIYNLPGCATNNVWWNIEGEGEVKGAPLFVCLPHMGKRIVGRILSSISRAIITAFQNHSFSIQNMKNAYCMRMKEFDATSIPVTDHQQLYHKVYLYNYHTGSVVNPQDDIVVMNDNELAYSLYDAQTE